MRHQMDVAMQPNHPIKDLLGERKPYFVLFGISVHRGEVHLVDDGLGDVDAGDFVVDEGGGAGADDGELTEDESGISGTFADAEALGFVKQGDELLGTFDIKHRLSEDPSGTVVEFFDHPLEQVFHVFSCRIADGKGVDGAGSRIERLTGVVGAVVEAVDDAQQQGAVALEDPFDLGLVGEFGGIAGEGEDETDVEVVGAEQFGLEGEFVAVAHTHGRHDRLVKGTLELDRTQDGGHLEAGKGIVGDGESTHFFVEFVSANRFNDLGDGRTVGRVDLYGDKRRIAGEIFAKLFEHNRAPDKERL